MPVSSESTCRMSFASFSKMVVESGRWWMWFIMEEVAEMLIMHNDVNNSDSVSEHEGMEWRENAEREWNQVWFGGRSYFRGEFEMSVASRITITWIHFSFHFISSQILVMRKFLILVRTVYLVKLITSFFQIIGALYMVLLYSYCILYIVMVCIPQEREFQGIDTGGWQYVNTHSSVNFHLFWLKVCEHLKWAESYILS